MNTIPKLTLEQWAAMDAAASPGPWRSVANLRASENHRGYRILSPHDGGTYAFADVQPVDEDGVEGGHNAALIAATRGAPTALLAALRALAGNLDGRAQRAANGLDFKYSSALRYAAADLRRLISELDLAAPPREKE